MSSSFEIFVIALIVIAQLFVAYRTFTQINIMNDFLPSGRSSLKLEEYEIPTEEILGLDPSDVIGKIKYRVVSKNEEVTESNVEFSEVESENLKDILQDLSSDYAES